jgi:hypothetical protein
MRIHLGSKTFERSDNYNGAYTQLSFWAVSPSATKEEVDEWVEDYYPSTRCQHEWDCCGHYYARRPKWRRWGNILVVRQHWSQNV